MNIIILFLLLFLFLLIWIFFTNHTHQTIKNESIFTHINISAKKNELQFFSNLLTKDECKELIDLAKTQPMTPSQVVSDKSLSEYDVSSRNSTQVWIEAKSHPILQKLSKISEELTGYPSTNQESIQIVKYTQGGKFDAHYDSCVQNETICKEMNRGAGQRRTTLLVYLNEGMTGGETEFVNLNQKIKPETGKAILFYSSDDDDKIIENSKHRGCPVLEGEKWIATIWSHPLPFR